MFRALFKPATAETKPAEAAVAQPETVAVTPPVDIRDDGNDVVILADVPGVGSSGLDLTIEGQELLLRATPTAPTNGTLRYADRAPHRVYERRFTLSDGIDRDHIQATIADGVARITLARRSASRTRRIEIR